MFRNFESGKDKTRNPFDKSEFLKDDIWERKDVLGESLKSRKTKDPHNNFFPINIIYKNIYIALDYDGNNWNDRNRETIGFTNMERSGWKGIYASNIHDANTQLTIYLEGKKADNIVLETHGGPENYVNRNGEILATGTYMSVDNNNHNRIGERDLSNSIDGKNTRNQDDVNDLVNIIKQIKTKGNFYLQSCNTADSDIFFNNLRFLTGNTVNLFGSNEFTSTRFVLDKNKPGEANYTPAQLFNRNTITSNGGKLYQAGCSDDPPILLQNIKINDSGIVPF